MIEIPTVALPRKDSLGMTALEVLKNPLEWTIVLSIKLHIEV